MPVLITNPRFAPIPSDINSPADVAGLLFWYKAATDADITYGTGADVAAWADLSGNGNDATQPGGAIPQPAWAAALQNGLGGVVFLPGEWLILDSIVLPASTPLTIFIVASVTSYAIETAAHFLGDGGASGGYTFRINSSHQVNTVHTNTAELGNGTTDVGTACHLYTVTEEQGADRSWRIDGAAEGTSTTNATFTGGIGVIGANDNTGSNSLHGVIHEIYGYDSILGTSDRDALEALSLAEWGL